MYIIYLNITALDKQNICIILNHPDWIYLIPVKTKIITIVLIIYLARKSQALC